ncbi:phage portal protein [Streptomyces sp. HP-A2021]|uniref:phage portal protein n=1 Tax=Streptomyces sp. HP-A2021 TaxID=2927875 RepID=UPI001FAF0387|nr:phage portal protein [Streptomyces sp. HP-A2021]UOB09075.1 phage portal protein [Streptomyces sp. HP-A2021]
MARTLLGALSNAARTATTTPVPFASRAAAYSRGLFGASRGMTAQLDSMGSVSTLFAIVNRTAKAEAGVEWKLYRKAKSGRKEDRTEVTSHAALDLWNKPNAFYTQSEFVEAGAQHKQLTGEQWWVIAQHESVNLPLELWPVRPDRMRPVPDPESFLSGYMYTGPDGQQIALRKEDVIFIRTPHPTDPYRGIGPVQALLTDLDAVRYSAEWNRNFFLNSAEPGGIIEVPTHLGDTEFDELRERWNEQHKGVANAHRVAILEHGKWIDRKYTQRDMQFVELRNVGRETIREAFGFPKPMTGAVDDVNRANAEAGEVMFARWLVVPDLEAVKDALNHRLLPLYGATGQGLEFDYENPVPEDRDAEAKELTAKVTAAKTLVEAGFEAASVREALGLPEMETSAAVGGDGTISPRELGDMIQSIYLGVDVCITWEEARDILNRAGAGLDLNVPPPAQIARRGRALAKTGAEPAPEPTDIWSETVAGLTGEDIEAAMRWQAVAVIDDNTCDPCRDNDGQLYRNRAAAYTDYPGGSGYVHCTGAEFGNECRCRVVKRRKTGDDE